jgi:hypothetical protein
MGWLQKLLGREKSHEQWLSEHPGKNTTKYVQATASEEEEQHIREKMERELDDARAARNE